MRTHGAHCRLSLVRLSCAASCDVDTCISPLSSYLDRNALTSLPPNVFTNTRAILFLGLAYNQLTETSLDAQLLSQMQALQIM